MKPVYSKLLIACVFKTFFSTLCQNAILISTDFNSINYRFIIDFNMQRDAPFNFSLSLDRLSQVCMLEIGKKSRIYILV
jgi:hypothetical protein